MPATLALSAPNADLVEQYLTAMRGLDRKTGRSTTQAALSFCAKLERSGSWEKLSLAQQRDAITKARSFVSWLLVTGKLTIPAGLMTHVDLRLGVIARGHCPSTHSWFVAAGEKLRLQPYDIALQWNALMKATAISGIKPDRLTDKDFDAAREAIIAAYFNRGMPSSGRNMSAIFTRLRLTLFHCGQLSAPKRRSTKPLVTVSGWTEVPASSPTPLGATSPRSSSACDPTPSSTSTRPYASSAAGWVRTARRSATARISPEATSRTTRAGSVPVTAVTPASP